MRSLVLWAIYGSLLVCCESQAMLVEEAKPLKAEWCEVKIKIHELLSSAAVDVHANLEDLKDELEECEEGLEDYKIEAVQNKDNQWYKEVIATKGLIDRLVKINDRNTFTNFCDALLKAESRTIITSWPFLLKKNEEAPQFSGIDQYGTYFNKTR